MGRRSSTQLPEYVAHAGTTPPDDPDLLDQLSFEHRQIQRLWSELQLAHRRHVEDVHRPEARLGIVGQRELGRQIVAALARHEADELERLYPAVARVVGEEWAEHATADHADIRDLLHEVEGENPQDDGVFEIFTEVLTKVLAHIDEEEKIIFPMLRAMGPGEALAYRGGEEEPEAARPGPRVIDLADAGADGVPASPTPDGSGVTTGRDTRRRRLLRR